MTVQDKCTDLALWLRRVLAEGLPLPDSILDYMAATFGTSDMAAIIEEDGSGEVDSLLELIFFPDMDLQVRFESKWGSENFTPKDLETVQHLMGQSPLTATILPLEDAPGIPIGVPAFALTAFVQRLNITWQIVPQLLKTLANSWPEGDALRARVHLRNARLDWHAHQVKLVDQFLAGMPPDADDTEICMTFLLSILSEFSHNTDPFNFLIAKKFFYFQSLCKAEDFERKRHTSNMEIMMLQGSLSAHGSVAQWRQQMQWIDHICYTLFGRTHFFQQPDERCVALPSGNNNHMLDDVIRSLS